MIDRCVHIYRPWEWQYRPPIMATGELAFPCENQRSFFSDGKQTLFRSVDLKLVTRMRMAGFFYTIDG